MVPMLCPPLLNFRVPSLRSSVMVISHLPSWNWNSGPALPLWRAVEPLQDLATCCQLARLLTWKYLPST